jgi:1,4-alpha-glucan branching enzyme
MPAGDSERRHSTDRARVERRLVDGVGAVTARVTRCGSTRLHLASWRHGVHGYRELARAIADHVAALGFTHVELMPVAEHPFGGSWGYQVTGYYAPSAASGARRLPEFVDVLHQRGIGVIVDWVPAHFPRDD